MALVLFDNVPTGAFTIAGGSICTCTDGLSLVPACIKVKKKNPTSFCQPNSWPLVPIMVTLDSLPKHASGSCMGSLYDIHVTYVVVWPDQEA